MSHLAITLNDFRLSAWPMKLGQSAKAYYTARDISVTWSACASNRRPGAQVSPESCARRYGQGASRCCSLGEIWVPSRRLELSQLRGPAVRTQPELSEVGRRLFLHVGRCGGLKPTLETLGQSAIGFYPCGGLATCVDVSALGALKPRAARAA